MPTSSLDSSPNRRHGAVILKWSNFDWPPIRAAREPLERKPSLTQQLGDRRIRLHRYFGELTTTGTTRPGLVILGHQVEGTGIDDRHRQYLVATASASPSPSPLDDDR